MKRTALAVVLTLTLAAPNILAQTDNSPKPPDKPADAKSDPGIRKLSRRERKDRIKNLSDKYRQFLTDVEPIMQPSELDTFLILETDAQREIYITEFWRRRDVAHGTTNHSFRDEYYARLETAKEQFRNVSCDRSRIYLIHGEPAERLKVDCRIVQPMEIWKYIYIPGLGHEIRFLFYVPRNGVDYRLWTPMGGQEEMAELVSQDAIGTSVGPQAGIGAVFGPVNPYTSMSNLEYQCKDGDEVMKAVTQSMMNKADLQKVFQPPEVNEEDVHKILRSVVIATPNAKPLSATFAVSFPAKQGSKTDAEMTLLVPRSQLTVKDVGGTRLYSLDVTGEVLKDDEMFENYRYRFDYPGDLKEEQVAAVIDRFLRPADYKARIKITDANSDAEAIIDADGHYAEFVPALMDYVRQVGGPRMLERYEKYAKTGAQTMGSPCLSAAMVAP